jgi:hypothetical protein
VEDDSRVNSSFPVLRSGYWTVKRHGVAAGFLLAVGGCGARSSDEGASRSTRVRDSADEGVPDERSSAETKAGSDIEDPVPRDTDGFAADTEAPVESKSGSADDPQLDEAQADAPPDRQEPLTDVNANTDQGDGRTAQSDAERIESEAQEAFCEDVVPCGGDPVGTWLVTQSCLLLAGEVDLSGFGLGCPSAEATGSLQVTGQWQLSADGSFTDETTTIGYEEFDVEQECLLVSGTWTTCPRLSAPLASFGFAANTCEEAPSGGCICSATIDQGGGAALVSFDAVREGSFATSGDVLTISGGRSDAQYSYCLTGDTLTLTPRGAINVGTVTGTIVFERQ